MQLIKPKQISGEIMTLIEEASKQLVIVSPYYNVSKWYKLLNAFASIKNKNVSIEFYVRKSEDESFSDIKSIGFIPFEIPNLHTKLYVNESYGIVSSMNLNVSSDTNSLDIAYKTETEEEYAELYKYYETYIKVHSVNEVIGKNEISSAETVAKVLKSDHPIKQIISSPPSFKDFLITDPSINYTNWKEIVVDFIKVKLNCKHARQYIHNNTKYFYTNIVSFGCFFYESRNKISFRIKFSLGGSSFDEIVKHVTDLTENSGARIELPNSKFSCTDIFISYDEEVLSKDFNYIHNEDVATITKTISCVLYVLVSGNYFSALKQKPKKDGILSWS